MSGLTISYRMTGNSQNFARIKLGIKLISDSVVNVETNLNGMNLKGWSTFYLVWTTQTYVSKLHCQRALLFQ